MKKTIAGFLLGIFFILLVSAAVRVVITKTVKSTVVPSFEEIGPKTNLKQQQNNSTLGVQTKNNNNDNEEEEEDKLNKETVKSTTDIPIFTPSSVKTKVRTNDSLVLALETAVSKEEVTSFYQKDLTSKGFIEENTATFGSAKVYSFLKGGVERVLLIIYSVGNKTSLVLTTQPNP